MFNLIKCIAQYLIMIHITKYSSIKNHTILVWHII